MPASRGTATLRDEGSGANFSTDPVGLIAGPRTVPAGRCVDDPHLGTSRAECDAMALVVS
jgi:hypothetical protein